MLQVEKERIVSLRYTMKDDKGNLLEDLMDKEPVEFLYGTGRILPELESHLTGLKQGDNTSLSFALDFGSSRTLFHFDVVIDQVRSATESELANGQPEQTKASEDCGPDCRC